MNIVKRIYWKLYREICKPSDEQYLIKQFELYVGYKPNIKNQKSYLEKLLWLKLNWRSDLAKKVVDKYLVREYVAEKGMSKYLVELYGVYDKFEEIDFDTLPNSFVIKNTGDSGGVKVIKNKNEMNYKTTKEFFENLKTNTISNYAKEWVYEGLQNRIVVERIIETKDNHSPKDYKFFCFNGEPQFLFVGSERDVDVKFDFFDLDFNHLPVHNGHEWSKEKIEKPSNFDEMLEVCKVLSKDFPHVRVDLYSENNKIYFGELTFFHFGGIVPFEPREYDYLFGEKFDLPKINNASEGEL